MIDYFKNIKFIFFLLIFVILLSVNLTGCSGCDKDAGQGGITFGGQPGAAQPPGPGPVVPAAQGAPDLMWAQVEMTNAQGQPVQTPTVGESVNIYAVMYNNSDTPANSVDAVMKIDGTEAQRGNRLTCNARRSNQMVRQNYSFASAGDHVLTLDITGSDPAEIDTVPGNSRANITIRVNPVPPAPGNLSDLTSEISFIPDGSDEPVTEVTVPQQGRIHYKVCNTGIATARDIEIRITSNGNDIFRNQAGGNTANIGSLDPRQCYEEDVTNFRIVQERVNVLWMKADPNGAIPESDNTNNEDTASILGLAPGAADSLPELEVVNLFMSRSYMGEPIDSTYTRTGIWKNAEIKNTGSVPAQNVKGYFQINQGPKMWFDLGTISPGQTVPCGGVYTFNNPGMYKIIFRVNPDNTTREMNGAAGNNRSIDFTVRQGARHTGGPAPLEVVPDEGVNFVHTGLSFIPERVEGPSGLILPYVSSGNIEIGQQGTLACDISNPSDRNFEGVNMRMRMNGRDIRGGQKSIPLPSHGMGFFRVDYTFEEPGSHIATFEIDYDDRVRENDETDNIAEEIFNVRERHLRARGEDVSNHLECLNIQFIPEGGLDSVTRTTVGRKGKLFGTFYNTNRNDTVSGVHARIKVDGSQVGQEGTVTIFRNQITSYDLNNYSFDSTGRHTMTLEIDKGSMRDSISRYIIVDEAIAQQAGDAAQQPAAAPAQNAPRTCDLVADSIAYWGPSDEGPGGDVWVYAGDSFDVTYEIRNRLSSAISGVGVEIVFKLNGQSKYTIRDYNITVPGSPSRTEPAEYEGRKRGVVLTTPNPPGGKYLVEFKVIPPRGYSQPAAKIRDLTRLSSLDVKPRPVSRPPARRPARGSARSPSYDYSQTQQLNRLIQGWTGSSDGSGSSQTSYTAPSATTTSSPKPVFTSVQPDAYTGSKTTSTTTSRPTTKVKSPLLFNVQK